MDLDSKGTLSNIFAGALGLVLLGFLWKHCEGEMDDVGGSPVRTSLSAVPVNDELVP